MLWSGGQKPIRGEDVWVLRENLPDLPKSNLEVSTEWICGGGRGYSRENIQRVCIPNTSSSHINQESMMSEKIGAKDGNKGLEPAGRTRRSVEI